MRTKLFASALLGAALALAPGPARAHCDTLDGPVVADLKAAIGSGDVARALKWVREGDEKPVRDAFALTLKVRVLGDEAQRLADFHFFETVVRLHRESEGASYTGLKPAGTIEPAILAADRALDDGKIDALVEDVTRSVAQGLRTRFEHAREAKQHANESIKAGREYVEAYVAYVHYIEAIHAAGSACPHE